MASAFKKIALFTAAFLLAAWIFYIYQISAPFSSTEKKIPFTIAFGSGVHKISGDLFSSGIIRSKFWFETYIWRKKLDRNFSTGIYELSPNMSIRQIVAMLTNPGGSELEITIIEGWNNREIADYLESAGLSIKESFLNVVGSNLGAYAADYDFLHDKPKSADLEGYLFPDTYRVYKNSTADQIARKMLNNFGYKLSNDLRESIKHQNKTIFEIVTLASILEKEVITSEEKKMVADIFYKRLRDGIAMQSDATINYITGKGLTRPTIDDLAVDNLFNTYKYSGLPPGPISNPGMESIEAAISPTPNPYYYFLTTQDGTVIYSKTYSEHLANKQKYLKPAR